MADPSGKITDKLIKRYQTIAKGSVGMIIPGYMYVHPLGRAHNYPIGIHKDEMISGLRNLVDTVHKEGSKIFFQ